MSYDVHISYPSVANDWFNYTYNCSPMFRDVLHDGINGLHEMSAVEASARLMEAIAKMEADPEKYRAMNPANGWGDYGGALEFLRNIKRSCDEHPNAKITVC